MKGRVESTIPSGVPYGNIRVTYEFENEDERIDAFTKMEADIKYYNNIIAREYEKAGDEMEKEYGEKRGEWIDGKYVSKDQKAYDDFMAKKEGKE